MQEIRAVSGTDRQELIVELVNRQQRVSIAEICEMFNISEATVRRDLETLDTQGLLRRVHGGAIMARQAPPELPILERSTDQAREKRNIGHAAGSLVQDGDSIFLGSGSTVSEMLRSLRERKDLTVITNSLPVVNALSNLPDITPVMLGGILRSSELSFIGHITEQALADIHVNKVFIGTRAIDVQEGLTNAYMPETQTDRAILKIGREIIVLADHTKCGRVSTVRLAPLNSIHTLITDQKTPAEFVQSLREAGIRVLQV